MFRRNFRHFLAAVFAILVIPQPAVRAHSHMAAGSNGGKLAFYDSSNQLLPLQNPYTYHMVYRNPGSGFFGYEGYYSFDELLPNELYSQDYFTFISLSNGEVETSLGNHAPTGTLVTLQILNVQGPQDSSFHFWESNYAINSATPTVSIPADGSPANFSYLISEPLFGFPQETQDPWGHIHGRGFTASEPGEYTVTFRLIDGSGLNLVLPSDNYEFTFLAVPEPASVLLIILGCLTIGLVRHRETTNKTTQ